MKINIFFMTLLVHIFIAYRLLFPAFSEINFAKGYFKQKAVANVNFNHKQFSSKRIESTKSVVVVMYIEDLCGFYRPGIITDFERKVRRLSILRAKHPRRSAVSLALPLLITEAVMT